MSLAKSKSFWHTPGAAAYSTADGQHARVLNGQTRRQASLDIRSERKDRRHFLNVRPRCTDHSTSRHVDAPRRNGDVRALPDKESRQQPWPDCG